ncbi:transposase [Escherichia coli]|nr:transposase [Escherichia coli]
MIVLISYPSYGTSILRLKSSRFGYPFVIIRRSYSRNIIRLVGLDAGVSKLATLSDGTVFEPVNSFKKNQKKLARLQRQLSRKVKFSNNWQK